MAVTPLDFALLDLHLGHNGLAHGSDGMAYSQDVGAAGGGTSGGGGGGSIPASSYVSPPEAGTQPSAAAARAASQQTFATVGDINANPAGFYASLGETQDPGTGYWIPPGESLQSVAGGAPNIGQFSGSWGPAFTGTGETVLAPSYTGPPVPGAIQLGPGQAAEQVDGSYVAYTPNQTAPIPDYDITDHPSGLAPGWQNYLPSNLGSH